jgi:hypothetical protein
VVELRQKIAEYFIIGDRKVASESFPEPVQVALRQKTHGYDAIVRHFLFLTAHERTAEGESRNGSLNVAPSPIGGERG